MTNTHFKIPPSEKSLSFLGPIQRDYIRLAKTLTKESIADKFYIFR